MISKIKATQNPDGTVNFQLVEVEEVSEQEKKRRWLNYVIASIYLEKSKTITSELLNTKFK